MKFQYKSALSLNPYNLNLTFYYYLNLKKPNTMIKTSLAGNQIAMAISQLNVKV